MKRARRILLTGAGGPATLPPWRCRQERNRQDPGSWPPSAPQVWVLCFVSLLADLSGELVYPIIPLFITGTLGAPVLAVGVVEGLGEATANITRLFSGSWSDRAARKKPFIVAGYGLAAMGKGVVALSPAWPMAMVGRSIDRFGKGIRGTPRDVLLAEAATPENRGRVFGLHRTMDTLGAVAGPLIGLGLITLFDGRLRLAIAVAVVPGLLSVFALRWLHEERAERAPLERRPAIRIHGFPRRFYILLAITVLFMAGNSSDAFLILRGKDLGLTTTLVVFAYVAYNVVYAGLSYPAGVISDRVPRSWLLVAGYGIFAVVYAGFAFVNTASMVWPLFAVYGAYIALTDGVSKALVSDVSPAEVRGGALGLYQGLSGLAALVASIMAGVLWDQVAVSAPFWLGAATALAAALALAGFTLGGGFRASSPDAAALAASNG